MKKVLSTSDVCHYFANQLQEEGRNSNNTIFFKNTYIGSNFEKALTIYSYGHHFPISRHLKDKNQKSIVLFTVRDYSNTTSKHKYNVLRALPDDNIIYCCLSDYHSDTIINSFNYWISSIEVNISKLKKAKKPELYINAIERLKTQANKFIDTLGLTASSELQILLDATNTDEFLAFAEQKRVLIEKQEEQKRKLAIKKSKENISKFRAFKPYGYINTGLDYLRYNKENNTIETTQSVIIDYLDAKNLYRYITHLLPTLAKNEKKIIQGINVSHYRVNSISTKEVKIGCHTITIKEIINFANQLGW